MSRLRVTHPAPDKWAPTGATAYLMILHAVETHHGLIHGRLHADGDHCAIGCFFETNPRFALHDAVIDEVAAVNDSMPTVTPTQRRVRMLRWLKWKLTSLGMPGCKPRAA